MGELYWSIVVLALGACIGSFLNVVIYRWPRDLSVREPSRSFCPACRAQIAWYDNLPILSFVWLRGRCRHCAATISLQYPLVEAATALVFLITYDAFFVANQRMGITALGSDWPIFIAHLALWAGMIVLAVMDLEAYMVDIRVTWLLGGVGLLGHAFWTPPDSESWIRPGATQSAAMWAVLLGLAIGWILLRPRYAAEQEDLPEEPIPPIPPPPATRAGRWIWLLLPILLIGAYVIALNVTGPQLPVRPPVTTADAVPVIDADLASDASAWSAGIHFLRTRASAVFAWLVALDAGSIRLGLGLAVAFLGLALAASHPHAEADADIVEAIADEAAEARRTALAELRLLSPAIFLALAVLFVFARFPDLRDATDRVLHWTPYAHWQPLLGLSTAIAGWILGGAVGWLARIFFTLLFGKEALGMGDVHILGAAGAVAGWPVAVLGFFLAAPLTLLAIIVIHVRRQSRALPYGPWLALAFFITSIFQDRILLYLNVRWML